MRFWQGQGYVINVRVVEEAGRDRALFCVRSNILPTGYPPREPE
jgi:hypothetical protein